MLLLSIANTSMKPYPFKFEWTFDDVCGTLYILYATQEDMDAFEYPANVLNVNFTGDYMEHLKVPEGVQSLMCANLGLKTLEVPDSMIQLYCMNNRLRVLELPRDIEIVDAQFNILHDVEFREPPTSLLKINLKENRISSIDFPVPPSLYFVNIKKNIYLNYISPAIEAVINENADHIDADDNYDYVQY